MKLLVLAATLFLAASAGLVAAETHQHVHAGEIPAMGPDGRRLDPAAARHKMTDEQLAGLRAKVPLYRALTDREARMNMMMMGTNYEWYISDIDLRGDTGVLVLAHGVGEHSDALFAESLKPMAAKRPTAVAYGMAMMMSSQIQSAVDDLTDRGAKTIVLVPTAMTQFNSLTRQWKYIFGMADEAAYLAVPQVHSSASFLMTKHFDAHPLITDILLDHALEQSNNQQNEVLIIVAHGPETLEENEQDLALLQVHANRIKDRTEFVDVKAINIQDDAIPPIRKSNVTRLRRWITTAQRQGHDVIIDVAAAASFGVQAHIKQDLRGLKYAFAETGFIEHPKYLQWINAAIDERLPAD